MGQCLRGKMADVGLIPPAPATAIAEAETPAEPSETAAPVQPEPAPAENTATADEAVSSEAELDVTPPASEPAAPDAESENVVAANFGLLRAEPDGSVVMAGSGTPGSEVEVFADGELLGTADVEPSGDWVFVPDAPLAAGGQEITLGEAGKEGTSPESFVVVINDDKTTQPLVVASTPGEASEVLQGLNPSTQMASVEPDTAVSASAPATEQAAPAADAGVSAANVAEDDLPPVDAPENAAASSEASATDAEAPVNLATVDEADTTPASAAEQTVSTPLPDVPPSIDAIEIDGDRTFFAGAGPEDGTIRLYVDDQPVGDAGVADGRWLVEAGPVLDEPNQRVRADLIDPQDGSVEARAEVDFVLDLPEDENVDVAEANAPVDVPEAPQAPVNSPATNATAPAQPVNQADATPEIDAAAPVTTSVEAPVQPDAEVTAPTPSVDTASSTPDVPAGESGASAPVAETTNTEPQADEPAVPTMVAVSLGDPDAQRFASGKAIIRRGDNLWTIARRVYGQGVRYTTIYEANNGQIRDPDRIYPGQVFDLPNNQ